MVEVVGIRRSLMVEVVGMRVYRIATGQARREPKQAGARGRGQQGVFHRKVDIKLPEKGSSNSHGARLVY